ncbi:MAG: hypothetical protein J2P28_02815 [Actinobacteria bacterium]|nr:hypothetical protein [Actinomycetota bacterium]
MAWARLDDKRAMNRKLRAAGFAARGLDEAAICQIAGDETDGYISEDTVVMLAQAHKEKRWRKLVDALVEAERWDPVEGGWMVRNYLEFNPSHADLEAKREADRKRQGKRRGTGASKPTGRGNSNKPPARLDFDEALSRFGSQRDTAVESR